MVADTLRPVPTVDLADRPLRGYREQLAGTLVDHQLSSIDVYMLTLLFEFLRGPLAVTDLTGLPAEVSSLALRHGRVSRVVTWPGEANGEPSWLACTAALQSLSGDGARWEMSTDLESTVQRARRVPGEVFGQHVAVIAGQRHAEASEVSRIAHAVLDVNPAAVVVVAGLGRIGECRQLVSLACAFAPGSRRKMILARELRGMVQDCSLGFFHDDANDHFMMTLERIENLFITNYDYLDLLAQRRDLRVDNRRGYSSELGPRCRNALLPKRAMEWICYLRRSSAMPKRPLFAAIPLQAGRRMFQFARRHRRWLAPRNSFRERLGKSLMGLQREPRAGTSAGDQTSEF